MNIENENSDVCKNKAIAQECDYVIKSIADIKTKF
jgi:hypothetical protein